MKDNDEKTTNELVEQLRSVARAVEQHEINMLFPSLYPPPGIDEPMEPLVRINEALHTIREGGRLDSQSVHQLIHYIADMMQV